MFENLNENQLKAVNHINGPCMVLAGPGSGKTRVIIYRILNMVLNNNIDPRDILAISFTKASSIEMKNRANNLNPILENVTYATFHSVFFRFLRYFKNYNLDSIIDEKNKRLCFKKILRTLNIEEDDDTINQIISEISYIKNELMKASDFTSEVISKGEFTYIYDMYEEYKSSINKIDFDDMLIHTYDMLKNNEIILKKVRNFYKYILIDEFQDINKVQFEIIKLISNPTNNIFVVGDEDQSIYGFRGSRPDFLLEFSNYFENAKKIVLDINYRSEKEIIDISNKLILNNKNRYEKIIKCHKEGIGEINYINPKDTEEEATDIANDIVKNLDKYKYTDTAVIYRTNIQSRALIDIFLDMRIPFVMKDSIITIYEHWVAQDILCYLRLCIDSNFNEDWLRIINRPFRYISKDTLESIKNEENILNALINKCDLHKKQIMTLKDLQIDMDYIKRMSPDNAISYIRTTLDYDRYVLDYCENRKIKPNGLIEILNEIESSSSNFKTIKEYLEHIEIVKEEISSKKKRDDGVVFTTMHSSKGLEFNNVYIIGVNEGTIPHKKSYDIEDEDIKLRQIEEERRLMYVAITRAKERLCISSPIEKHSKRTKTSRFLEEILETTKEKTKKTKTKKEEIKSIKVGDKIYHKIFKEGTITEVEGEKITIKFKDKKRELNSKICIINKIIKKL